LEYVVREAGARDSKRVWERAFGVVWVGAIEMEILHAAGTCDVYASVQFRKVGCFLEDHVNLMGNVQLRFCSNILSDSYPWVQITMSINTAKPDEKVSEVSNSGVVSPGVP